MQSIFLLLCFTFFVMALGSVPNCGASGGRSTGLFMSDGTDSVLRILATGRHIGNVKKYVQHTVRMSISNVSTDRREEG